MHKMSLTIKVAHCGKIEPHVPLWSQDDLVLRWMTAKRCNNVRCEFSLPRPALLITVRLPLPQRCELTQLLLVVHVLSTWPGLSYVVVDDKVEIIGTCLVRL